MTSDHNPAREYSRHRERVERRGEAFPLSAFQDDDGDDDGAVPVGDDIEHTPDGSHTHSDSESPDEDSGAADVVDPEPDTERDTHQDHESEEADAGQQDPYRDVVEPRKTADPRTGLRRLRAARPVINELIAHEFLRSPPLAQPSKRTSSGSRVLCRNRIDRPTQRCGEIELVSSPQKSLRCKITPSGSSTMKRNR